MKENFMRPVVSLSLAVMVLAASAAREARAESEVLTGPLLTARALQTATLLPNGKVLAASGYNGTLGNVATAELYDPTTGTGPTPDL